MKGKELVKNKKEKSRHRRIDENCHILTVGSHKHTYANRGNMLMLPEVFRVYVQL